MNQEQFKQLQKQLRAHRHKRYEVDIKLTDGHVLKDFVVYPRVLRPDKVTALYLARWLFFNNNLYKDKTAIDMGSGTGIQGVVMGLYGANQVIFSDKSEIAVDNTRENIRKFNLEDKSTVYHSDLFEKINDKADLVVFNHPFFSDSSFEQVYVPMAMLSKEELIHRFFEEAKEHLKDSESRIIMPYYHLAGPVNNPAEQAPKHGYNVIERLSLDVRTGLQRGPISIYELSASKR